MSDWVDDLFDKAERNDNLCGFSKLGYVESLLQSAAMPHEEKEEIENRLHLLREWEADELIIKLKECQTRFM